MLKLSFWVLLEAFSKSKSGSSSGAFAWKAAKLTSWSTECYKRFVCCLDVDLTCQLSIGSCIMMWKWFLEYEWCICLNIHKIFAKEILFLKTSGERTISHGNRLNSCIWALGSLHLLQKVCVAWYPFEVSSSRGSHASRSARASLWMHTSVVG